MSAYEHPFAWRHICFQNEDFSVTLDPVYGGDIVIPHNTRWQGTYPNINKLTRQTIPMGGFLCTPDVIEQPTKGILYTTGVGWWYSPSSPGYKGTDKITFQMTYFGQVSKPATITINL